MTRAALKPTLPQNDNDEARQQRAAQLARTSTSYVWNTDAPTLKGVPLAASVHFNEAPTLVWLGIVVKTALAIARNVLALKLSGKDKTQTPSPNPDVDVSEAVRDKQRCDEIEQSAAELMKPQVDSRVTPAPDVSLFTDVRKDVGYVEQHLVKGAEEVAKDAEDVVASAEQLERTARLRDHLEELRRMVEKHTSDLTRTLSPRAGEAVGASVSDYNALFATLPLPAIASTLLEDSTFARLRVAGPNPMLLLGVSQIPANFGVSEEHYQKAMGAGDSLESALADGRVYLLDYAELADITAGSWQGLPKFSYAPMALFAVPVGGASLQPVAIQCGQDAGQPIFTPSPASADTWGWEMAKTIVQVADGNYHELYVHLARTHLVIEAFAVATRRHLAEAHPLWGLLVPHFEGSIFINDLAAGSLIGEGGPIDHIFAGTIGSTQAAAAKDRLAFDFYGKMPPNDLAARSVDDVAKLPDYPYRDDALLVWNAIHDWAEQYVGIYYLSDGDVTGDTELSAWAGSIAGEGKIKGFKAITTRSQLVDVCAMILFTSSAQHAAVNFPQKDIMTYALAVSGAGWKGAPEDEAGQSKEEWLGYMLPVALALEQLNTLYLLGSVHYGRLGLYQNDSFLFPSWFRDPAVTSNALPRFQRALEEVERRIVTRNGERLSPYVYLQPSLIPMSINI